VISQDLLLVKILKIVLSVIPKVEVPKSVGRPFVYQPVVIICCLTVMVAKRLTVRGLYSFLTSRDDLQAEAVRKAIPFPGGIIPNRRTFDRRFKKSILLLQLYMLACISYLTSRFKLGISRLSLDNRMFEACGAIWHSKYQKRGIIPKGLRNVDETAGWGKSHYRGWVFGHGLDIFVTTGKLVVPVIALARSLVERGNSAVKRCVFLIPKVERGVVAADSEYEDSQPGTLILTRGRRLHTPAKRYPENVPKGKTYLKRKTTSEPFFERFLQCFVIRGKLDRKGPNAWPYLVACCFLYQLMVIYNLMEAKPNPLQVTHLIRML